MLLSTLSSLALRVSILFHSIEFLWVLLAVDFEHGVRNNATITAEGESTLGFYNIIPPFLNVTVGPNSTLLIANVTGTTRICVFPY